MFRLCYCAFFLTCFFLRATAQSPSDELKVQELLQRYTESYGGLRDVNRLDSISMEGIQVQGKQKFSFQIRKKRPSSMRYRLMKGDTSLVSIFNGQRGWLLTNKGSSASVEELSGAKLDILVREARFESPLYRHQEKLDVRVSMVGREQIGDTKAYILRVEEQGAPVSHYFLDPEKPHILRIDQLDDEGRVTFQTLYRDYRDVDGYPFAHVIENRIEGETVSLSRLDSVSVNPGLLSVYFENPSL
ncbi:MAG: hypothetical protein ACPGSB_03325 [Opitutales bacterium]